MGPAMYARDLCFRHRIRPSTSLCRETNTHKKRPLCSLWIPSSVLAKNQGGMDKSSGLQRVDPWQRNSPSPVEFVTVIFVFFVFFFVKHTPRSLSTVPASAPFSQKDRCMHLGKLGRLWQLIMGSEWGFLLSTVQLPRGSWPKEPRGPCSRTREGNSFIMHTVRPPKDPPKQTLFSIHLHGFKSPLVSSLVLILLPARPYFFIIISVRKAVE